MSGQEALQQDLAALHQASLRMDELVGRAQAERSPQVGGALVEAVANWVGLVESFVERCDDEKVLETYTIVTTRLEQLLSRLETAQSADEVQDIRRALPEVVEAWSQVMAELIQAALKDADAVNGG